MSIVLFGDCHVGARQDSEIFSEYFLSFFENQFFPYIKEHPEVTDIVCLGDLFDRRKFVNFKTWNTWRLRFLLPLRNLAKARLIKFHFIVGNHDAALRESNRINSLTELGLHIEFSVDEPNFFVYPGPTEVIIDGHKVLFLPWINDENRAKSLELIKSTDARIVMGHLEVIGFEQIRGHVNQDKGLTPDVFSKFDRVFSGHFHCKSTINNIHYLGSPYHITWNDYGDPRGFHTYNQNNGHLEFHENETTLFHKVFYDDSIKKSWEDYKDLDFQGKYVKVIVQKKNNPWLFEQVLAAINASNPSDVSVVEVLSTEDSEEVGIDQSKDTLTLLIEHLDALEISEQKNELTDLLRMLYNEALEASFSLNE